MVHAISECGGLRVGAPSLPAWPLRLRPCETRGADRLGLLSFVHTSRINEARREGARVGAPIHTTKLPPPLISDRPNLRREQTLRNERSRFKRSPNQKRKPNRPSDFSPHLRNDVAVALAVAIACETKGSETPADASPVQPSVSPSTARLPIGYRWY